MQHDERGRAAAYEGIGPTLDAALEAAAGSAVADSADAIGKEYDVVLHVVTVANPRISQHKVVISER